MTAVRQSSIHPARALGLPDAGLAAGASADLVVLDDELAVAGVLRNGAWVVDPGAQRVAAAPSTNDQ
jgi:N-acetylglucosamine-6-phosphate deacetylase